ncbi:response regulator transcription factor [Mucilaginibacter sp. X4EP1]|uniref:response regulator transcription factor n=1 Tax=Mucilaginibacter sp. X4EP1 TaxID=2723092 RepID=UPI002168FEFD|nr:response regulator transcription factor [Mucilaginibacter sp. X4EP1]MCS3814022.1 DNA-binding response OmpR family regulator [Mucilaginibacter sp. X4EP1]
MMEKIKVLLVEDEPVLAAIVKESLETRGFAISIAVNGVEGWGMFNSDKPDVCVIDVMMPRKNGFSLVSDIRTIDDLVPIIFLTARTQTEDVLKGFEIGADDYMKKPFSMEELIVRLKAVVRRKQAVAKRRFEPAEEQAIGIFSFNFKKLELTQNGHILTLSQREGELLNLLLHHRNQLLERKTALIKLWGDDSPLNVRSMDVYITRLRKLLQNDSSIEIINARGQGYRLVERL